MPESTYSSDDVAPLTEAERAAARAYLQRCEVRLSTQHRVATAFIGGAGLLLLIPIFLRDIVDGELSVLINFVQNLFPQLGDVAGWLVSAVLQFSLAYPLALSLIIPIYGVYLLLKDLVHFYYTLYMPGSERDLLNPTFALGGVTFSTDESQRIKRRVLEYQYADGHADFMMPFSRGKREAYFDSMVKDTNGGVIPEGRDLESLRAAGVLAADADPATVQHIGVAFGLARTIDRSLVQEIAVTEMQLVRNVMYLRRLMLRYVKTLLLFIWTTTISFILLPMLKDARFPALLVMALGYLVWSIAVVPLMTVPVRWIFRHRHDTPQDGHIDAQLTQLEEHMARWCKLAIVSSVAATILATIWAVAPH